MGVASFLSISVRPYWVLKVREDYPALAILGPEFVEPEIHLSEHPWPSFGLLRADNHESDGPVWLRHEPHTEEVLEQGPVVHHSLVHRLDLGLKALDPAFEIFSVRSFVTHFDLSFSMASMASAALYAFSARTVKFISLFQFSVSDAYIPCNAIPANQSRRDIPSQ